MLIHPAPVVQFNVPLSSCNGTIINPPAQYQYPVDKNAIVPSQYLSNIPDHDWCQFGVFNNDQTGFSPLKAQGASYKLANVVPPADGSTLRMTGYGADDDPPGICPPSYSLNEYNYTQQTHSGPYQQKVGTEVRYVIDILPGNSGSAVERIASGLVYAINSGGFCGFGGDYNSGTAIDHPGLQAALACPVGICADCNGNGILDQCDLNCASPCGGCNVPGCGGSSDCNSNGVPDDCDITHGTSRDCNNNSIPDSCDIASQSRIDCDMDGIPDECDAGGACCLSDRSCVKTPTSVCCDALGGVHWYGLGSKCRTTDCFIGPSGPQGP